MACRATLWRGAAHQPVEAGQDLRRAHALVLVGVGDIPTHDGQLTGEIGHLLPSRRLPLICRGQLETVIHIPHDEQRQEQGGHQDDCAQPSEGLSSPK